MVPWNICASLVVRIEDLSVWHVPGFAAFNHRCRE
jgi:hypothetical protein